MTTLNYPVIYISGPISSSGVLEENLAAFDATFCKLMRTGFSVINPGPSARIAGNEQFTHQEWMDHDEKLVALVDALLRMPGKSLGADIEVGFAAKYGIPVFHSVEELIETMGPSIIEQPNEVELEDGGIS